MHRVYLKVPELKEEVWCKPCWWVWLTSSLRWLPSLLWTVWTQTFAHYRFYRYGFRAFAVALCDGMDVKGVLPYSPIIVYAAFFMMSWGPICWVLIAEIFQHDSCKAVAIAVAFQWVFNYILSSTFPALYDFSGPVFVYSLYGSICILAALFVWRWVPETRR